jgi:hypothetical protein
VGQKGVIELGEVELSSYGLDRLVGFQEGEAPSFLHKRHMKLVRLLALQTGRLYLQEISLVLISVRG